MQHAVARLQPLLQRLWRLPWSNQHKEVLWLLLHDGIPTTARIHATSSCACGAPSPGRLHHFWDCPLARAVVEVLSSSLHGIFVSRDSVWLCLPPAGVHAEVWELVCLCALCAMDRGRRAAWQRMQHGLQPGPALISALSRHVIARFWELLSDFCAVNAAPASWERLPPSHPFISFDTSSATCRVRQV